jgi:hypothetical protein
MLIYLAEFQGLTLTKLPVIRFLGAGSFLIRYSKVHGNKHMAN